MSLYTNLSQNNKLQKTSIGALQLKRIVSPGPSAPFVSMDETRRPSDVSKALIVPHCSSLPYLRRMRSIMNDMRLEGKYTDLVLVCGQRAFPCHRMLLVACSKFFEELLRSDDPTTTVELEDVPENVMELMLNFVYTGQVDPPDALPEVVLHTLTTAQLLQLQGAPDKLCSGWLRQSPAQRIALFLDWADEFSNDKVREVVLDHIMKHFTEVAMGNELQNFTPDQLKSVLIHPELPVSCQSSVIASAVARWLNQDIVSRQTYLNQLVGLGLVPSRLVKELPLDEDKDKKKTICVVKVPDYPNASKTTCLVQQGVSPQQQHLSVSRERLSFKDAKPGIQRRASPSHRSVSRERLMGSVKTPPEEDASTTAVGNNMFRQISPIITFHDALIDHYGPALLVVSQADNDNMLAHIYLPVAAVWSQPVKIPTPYVLNRAMLNVGGLLYFVGGEVHERKLPTVFSFDMKNEKLIPNSPMCLPRSSTRMIHTGASLMVVGGIGRLKTPLTHVERYDMALDVWRVMPTMHYKRYEAGVVAVDQSIYALGGFTTQCEVLHLGHEDLGWQKLSPLPESFEDLPVLAVAKAGNIFVFRTYRPDKVWVLDTRQTIWSSLRVSGHLPQGLVEMFGHGEDFYALDNAGRLHMFDTNQSLWRNSITCPKSCLKSVHIAFVDLDQLHS